LFEIRNLHNLGLIAEAASVPVVVDAGIGNASDDARALEFGAHAELVANGSLAPPTPRRSSAGCMSGCYL
jgi:thiazole synthase